MNKDVFNIIKSKYDDMSKGHKRIADYLLENYQKASFMTAASLGQIVGVSESTVVRFATELGYEGYPEFQDNLREIMKVRLTSAQRIEVASSMMRDEDVYEKVMSLDIERIRNTIENGDRAAFAGSVEAIAGARRIYIVASRSAAAPAAFLKYYLSIMFEDVKLLSNLGTSDLLQGLFRVGEDDIVIGLSFPRYSKQTTIAMDFCSERKAKVIAITDSMSSPIARNAKYVMTAGSDMVSFADSLVAPMSLINALIVAVSLKKQDEINQSFDTLEHIWDEYDVYEKSDNEQR